MKKTLFLIRGLPGSGETAFAKSICDKVVSIDDYFGGDQDDFDPQYDFDPSELPAAHQYCKEKAESIMQVGDDVAVASTFADKREIDDFYALAEKYGYTVLSMSILRAQVKI